MQTIRVQVFARFRDVFGEDVVAVELPDAATIGDLRAAVALRKGEISGLLARSRVAVNNEFADDATVVRADDVIALIPPVSGGCNL